MASVNKVKAERFANIGIELLKAQIILPGLVSRRGGTDFIGAKNDTVSYRVPALPGDARSMDLRATGSARDRVLDDLNETKIDLTLDYDLYKGTTVTDEVETLDELRWGTDVVAPLSSSVAYGLESAVADEITGATYQADLTFSANEDEDPFNSLVDAGTALDDRKVPFNNRILVVGSNVKSWILKSPHLNRYDGSGSDQALRQAQIGEYAGFTVIKSLAIPANEAYAFHKTAFVLSTVVPKFDAPEVFGAAVNSDGLSFRFTSGYNNIRMEHYCIVDVFAGTGHVTDDLGLGNGTKGLVRAAKITLNEGS